MNEGSRDLSATYLRQERQKGARRLRTGCYLVLALLPAGSLVDYLVYPAQAPHFAVIRLVSSVLVLPLLYLFYRPAGRRYYEMLSLLVAIIPGAAMCLIIHGAPDGAASPYYASLNLILLAIALIAQWDERLSFVAVLALLGMYVIATADTIPTYRGIFLSNLWFMMLTGIIVVVGSRIQSRLRYSDFCANYELRASRRELAASYAQLRQLDELKGRFFANISHELRTPLTLLLAPLESLLQDRSLADNHVRELLVTMRDNGMRLLKLINDLLDLVRLDAGRLKLQLAPIDIQPFIRGILNAANGLARDRGVHLECQVDPELTTVVADPDKLEKVFLNLLFNAIKFTAAGGHVTVNARKDDSRVEFTVSDTGMGIAKEHLPHLFDRFWQADSASNRKFQGAGIGLALVKELVEVHGGTVIPESEPGKGTTMRIHLPVRELPEQTAQPETDEAAAEPRETEAPAPAGDEKQETTPQAAWLRDLYRRAELFASVSSLHESVRPRDTMPGRGKQPRVLIVDDEPDMLRFLRMQLEEEYHLIEASDGDQAVTLAAQYLPEVVVCDLMMPEKDGMEVCQELRGRTSTENIPVLLLTARADDETKLRALQAGANDFLPKPFSVAELRARVKILCQTRQLQRAVEEQNKRLTAALEQLKDTETQLVQSEKMASLGRMSAGIIHEINNPLNFSLTALKMLHQASLHLPEDDREDFTDTLRDIEEGLRRVATIVGDLRCFTHPQGGELEEVNVARSVATALRFLSAEWKNKVEIDNQIPEDFTVLAIKGKLMQVFVNLLQNALDALRSHPPEGEAPTIRLRAEERQGSRFVTVRDNGPGIPQAHLTRIFEPFFTTKEIGQGTGLGLSICYRLLNEAGARLTVDSEEGRFCEFCLEFPPVEEAAATREQLLKTVSMQ